ncbi:hypothetical protein HD806DRAFT_506926 [Xylariaceae sp. AK1471]|nr:hypothetical protein HD806DRAFT_506926 [Xylariaceae sp. AK1471]
MHSLRKLVLLNLAGIVCSQDSTLGNSFVEFLTPKESEVVAADSTYLITWAAKSSAGRGTMILLTGQTSDSLSKLWEIAYSIDVAGQSFSWPVGSPTLGAQLASFYGLNFSLDGSEGVFTVSAPFKITSAESVSPSKSQTSEHSEGQDANGGDQNGDQDVDWDGDDQHSDGSPQQISTSISEKLTSQSERSQTPSLSSSVTDGNVSISLNDPTSLNVPTSTDIPATSKPPTSSNVPTNSNNDGGLAGGKIAGIVIGAVVALATFISLVGLVLYYRHRLLGKIGGSKSDNRGSKIDGKFRKAELDAEGPERKTTRVYELSATREVQEADGRMKPAELDPTNTRFELPAADIERERDSICTADDLDDMVSRAKVWSTMADWAFH